MNHISFITATVWMSLCQPGLGLSLQKAPEVLCSSFTMRDMDQCSCLTFTLPYFTDASPFQFPEKPVLPQSGCSLCCERMAREEQMSPSLLSLHCRQVLCPPSPPCLERGAVHGEPRKRGSWSKSSMF